jgi:putative heme-binding domain-containing protein
MELAKVPELDGGNWGNGRRLFLSESVGCSKCHTEPGSGIEPKLGPDLSNMPSRDYASNLRDILQPSHAINPEFIGHQVRLSDGTVLTGVLREQGGKLILGDAQGRMQEIVRSDIEQMVASKLSVMPTGLIDKLDQTQVRDLMTYLMKLPPSMPLSGPIAAPSLRTAAEVAQVLEGSKPLTGDLRRLKVVLIAGPKDHGPAEHDYPAWLMQWGQLLTAAPELDVQVGWEFPTQEQIADADVLIFFQKGSWDQARAAAMDAFFARGGGAIYLHWAVNGSDRVEDFSKRIGLASWGGKIQFRHGPLELQITNQNHPIMRNVPTLDLLDESYWKLTGDVSRIGLLATSQEDGQPTPQIWTYEPNGGRVFVSIPGHYSWTFDDPIFRIVVLRAIAWVAKEPIDRFNELVPLGARMKR